MSSSYEPNKPFWLDLRRGIYATPRAWAKKGENLVHAFRAVADASVEGDIHLDMTEQALMLAGMGIEAILKALIVEDTHTRDLVSRDRPQTPAFLRCPMLKFVPRTKAKKKLKKLWDTFYSHNLVALADLANVSLSKQQPKVAQALSAYIYWRGRYAMPMESGINDIIPIKHGKGPAGPRHRPVMDKQVEELIEHVVAEVHRRLQNKP